MIKDSDKIRGMFNDIAPRYDLLNHTLSFGIDKVWRKRVVKELRKSAPDRVLDLAAGTGDLTVAIAKGIKKCSIVAADLSPNMLAVAKNKFNRNGLLPRVEVCECSALELPFKTGEFDALTVAFGVRNYENLEKGLSEMLRVVKKGGVVYVLEFSKPRYSLISWPYLLYFRRVLPLIGRLVSGSAGAYSYLPNSVLTFPCGDDFIKIMQKVGYTNCTAKELSFGIATLYKGNI